MLCYLVPTTFVRCSFVHRPVLANLCLVIYIQPVLAKSPLSSMLLHTPGNEKSIAVFPNTVTLLHTSTTYVVSIHSLPLLSPAASCLSVLFTPQRIRTCSQHWRCPQLLFFQKKCFTPVFCHPCSLLECFWS